MSRVKEIVDSVDALFAVHDAWQDDAESPDYPTAEFEQAVERAREVLNVGDIPQQCRELDGALQRLFYEWDMYAEGIHRNGAKPLGRFWGAYRAVVVEREGATPFVPTRPEPVKVLLDQKVPTRQIALHIYGDGTGNQATCPLCGPNGEPDANKIQQEAENPGSVVPSNWIPPEQAAKLAKFQEETQRRIVNTEILEEERDYEDPSSAEDLLREGQYPAVVARVKNMSLQDVMAIAERLSQDGVKVNEHVPNLAAMRSTYEPQLTPEQDAALQPKKPPADENPITPEKPVTETDDGALESAITEVATDKPDANASVILEMVRQKLGDENAGSVQKVVAVLRKLKQPAGA